MSRRAAPLFATDDGWPYPDGIDDAAAADEIDLDALELRVDPHAFDTLDDTERQVVRGRFGLDGADPRTMKELSHDLGCTHAEVREILGSGIEKLRSRIITA